MVIGLVLLVSRGAVAQQSLKVADGASIELRQRDGSVIRPFDGDDGDLVVLVFGSVDCPIANSLVPEVRRIFDHVKRVGGTMYYVYPRCDQTEEAIATHAKTRKLTMPILHDSKHLLVRSLKATTTPEAFVVRRDGDVWTVVYRGLIDNLYADVGRRRRNATQFFVREAITAARAKTLIETPVRAPIGCLIERGTTK